MDITARLRGKRIAAVMTNGNTLRITADDGTEIDVVWADDNGRPLKGKPVIVNHGLRLVARGLQDLIHLPPQRANG